jgi:orotate phosphoribosyltransferase
MSERFLATVRARTGHFQFESGHHGDVWMDLETLCLHPGDLRPFAAELAARLRPCAVDVVCGPLNEGAFVALMVAEALRCEFGYAERLADAFPVRYRLPKPLGPIVRGRRIAVVNDVISAGSAVRGAIADLDAIGANVVAIASLLVLGPSIGAFARQRGIPVVALAERPHNLWLPEACPLCAEGVPLERLALPVT